MEGKACRSWGPLVTTISAQLQFGGGSLRLNTIPQSTGTVAITGAVTICVPFISQIAVLPSLWRQTMSALPSPLKSPTPTICQSTGTVAITRTGYDLSAVHQPDDDTSVIVAPENVGPAVPIEVPHTNDIPVDGNRRNH